MALIYGHHPDISVSETTASCIAHCACLLFNLRYSALPIKD